MTNQLNYIYSNTKFCTPKENHNSKLCLTAVGVSDLIYLGLIRSLLQLTMKASTFIAGHKYLNSLD